MTVKNADLLRETCDRLEAVLVGDIRSRIVDDITTGAAADALPRLRRAFKAQSFGSGPHVVDLERPVRKLDHATRREGFRVLHSWDHTVHRFREDITPVLMLDYYQREAAAQTPSSLSQAAVAMLLDYYFLHVLALCAMRCWDDPDPDDVLDRLSALVSALQGPGGSGHRFVADAETLLIYALSQFHPEEQAYDRFIDRVRSLSGERHVRFACVSSAVLSCHLRWGFWLMYGRDALRMRQDNVGDYPWLLDSVLTLAGEFSRLVESGTGPAARRSIAEALLLGLAADPWAFTSKTPAVLEGHEERHGRVRDLLLANAGVLLDDLDDLKPSKAAYAPLALHFNFPHNVVVAALAVALLSGEPQLLPLNALFESDAPGRESQGAESEDGRSGRERLARTLMAYSGERPDRLGARGAMLIAYDPLSGLRSHSMTVDAIRELR